MVRQRILSSMLISLHLIAAALLVSGYPLMAYLTALVLGIASYASGIGGRLRIGLLLVDTCIAAAGMLIISITGIEAAASISRLAEAAGDGSTRSLIDIMALALMAVPCVLAILTVKADEQRRKSRGYLAAALFSADKTNRAKEKE